jgi:hypothetical protein
MEDAVPRQVREDVVMADAVPRQAREDVVMEAREIALKRLLDRVPLGERRKFVPWHRILG